MEKFIYTGNERKIERFMLAVYSMYVIAMIMMSDHKGGLLLAVLLLIGWLVYGMAYRTYSFRVKLTAVLMQFGIAHYAMQTESLEKALPVFIAFILFLGLYGMEEVIFIATASSVFIFGWHALIKKTVAFESSDDVVIFLLEFANILLIQYIVYVWTRRNSEGSRQLLDKIDELRIVERSKDNFVANVSHEVRTPLNTITGMSELLLREELPNPVKENILNIQVASRKLMSVVGDILDFSELQSDVIELEEDVYNITSTIHDVINMAYAKKDEKKLEIIVDCDANIPSVILGDEKKLRRVMMNLIDNAIKFTEKGCVCISISYRKESYGMNLVIAVKDTGIGMSEEDLERLFESFEPLDGSRKRQEGGLGLGLAISRALVQKMGGAITVKSKPGKGTTIQVVVPQKIVDEKPIASLTCREDVKIATYIDMEQFEMREIRDEYSKVIQHMVEQLHGNCQVCRNLADLQRRAEVEEFSYVFISILEYRKNTQYFDELAKKTKVTVIADRYDDKYLSNLALLKVYKPFYIMTIAAVLNGNGHRREIKQESLSRKFVTRNAHVLVVDDNRMNLLVVEKLLETYGIKVTTAVSGKEALERIKTEEYDFVFMDHMMPEMDGVETLHHIRHMLSPYYQRVPIVALTANAVAGAREMLISEGFSDFLEKPIEKSVLERVLKRNLPLDKIVYVDEQEKEKDDEEDKLLIEGLDVEKGILYGNGKKQYLEILRGYCKDWDRTGVLAEESFAAKDWKNYTIAVHGLKSALRSIGATQISEQARKLEYAGKEYRIEYILKNHRAFMDEYRELFSMLSKNERICPPALEKAQKQEQQLQLQQLPVLEEADFEEKLSRMEEAVYSWDKDALLAVIQELEGFQYAQVPLYSVVEQIRRKVDMSDYASALESVVRWKSSVTQEGEKERG